MNPSEYEVMYRVEDRHWWYKALRGVVNDVLERHGSGSGKLLDAGCGTGANLKTIAGPYDDFGIDASMQAIQFCRKRGLAKTAAASLTELPFPDNSFEVVVSCDVLCHQSIPDKAAGVRELARVTAPGGIVIVNLPAYQWLYSSHDVAVYTDHRFNRKEVCSLMEQAGLSIVEARYWNSLLFPALAAVRLARKVWPPKDSDLAAGSGDSISGLIGAVMQVERSAGRIIPYPFGLSVLAAGRKNGRALNPH